MKVTRRFKRGLVVTSTKLGYRHNHYVPIWYQKRFMLSGQSRYYRLDCAPQPVKAWNSKKAEQVTYWQENPRHWSPEKIFAENDLYTAQWGALINTEIEQFFFGKIDVAAPKALDFFCNFKFPAPKAADHYNTFLEYMSIQKLRTPKGLAAFSRMVGSKDKNRTLLLLQQMRQIHCAIWSECVWSIATADQSATKFIISDHPVTVYNRECPPLSKWCAGGGDPDIRLHATHTYFPLSLDKILILTNLSWLRDPYQNGLKFRPNPDYFRGTVFSWQDVQTNRSLTEDEVLQINCVTKRRAGRYIAAAEEEWLYPERRVSTDHWKKLGLGYLFMPEPRLQFLGGRMVVGYDDGTSDGFSEYGHKPWQEGYNDNKREARERRSFEKFKAEYARIHGPKYTAQTSRFGGREIREDSEEATQRRERLLESLGRWRRGRGMAR